MPTPFQPQTLYDALGSFEGGVNEGASPLRLTPNTMSGAVNVTVRGDFATHRSAYVNRPITYATPDTKTAVETGKFQGCTATICQADDFTSSHVALISSRLFQFVISGNTVTCTEIQIQANGLGKQAGPSIPVQPQAWLWQSEYFVIIQDGLNLPIFFNLNDGTARRSNYFQPVSGSGTFSGEFKAGAGIPPIGLPDTILFSDITNLAVGNIVTVENIGTFQVLSIGDMASANDVLLLNLTGTPQGGTGMLNTPISWINQGTELPPGRMGAYGMGRNWFALVDGKQFVAGDIVGGASGTAANNFRDAVINITENLYIVGGGNFTVPGSVGAIQAMRFVAILDASLGQGPLQVLTNDRVFSCNTPVDRLTWQSITNPILTESLISNGGKGQNSTVLANGDLMFRSIDGIRSLILARRDFDTWGNVPISFEVMDTLANDDPGLLTYGSAIVFDNRLLHTVGTTQDTGEQGVYFQGLIALNFDPLSSIRGKQPSVWDGLWTGLNVMQLTVGEVTGVERAFAFVLNIGPTTAIQIWEIMPSPNPEKPSARDVFFDNDGTNDQLITWQFDSASLRFGVDPKDRKYMQLNNGEIWVAYVLHGITFDVMYRADQYPCWTDWFKWTTCQQGDQGASQLGYRPRMGLGSPSANVFDVGTNRPLRNGWTFQCRLVITGHCVFMGAFFEAIEKPFSKFAPMECCGVTK